jgi:large subunit ribosomal protein L17
MRHNKTINQLGRQASHRQAMMSNMAASLILHKRIATTLAKAKALRVYVEPLITKSKEDSTHSRRTVFSYLGNKEAVTELFREVSKKIADRPGGYTRILKTGTRLGDNASMCIIELVDYNQLMNGEKEAKAAAKAGTRRRRTSGAKKTTEKAVEVKEEKQAPKSKAKKTVEVAEEVTPETEVVDEVAPEAEIVDEVKIADEPEVKQEPEAKEDPEKDETTEAKKED